MAWRTTIGMDDAEFRQTVERLATRARDLRPAMDDIGDMLQTSTDLHFEREVDPDGNPWAPLAASTVKEKARLGCERMLQRSTRLRRSIVRTVGSSSVTLGTNLAYAAAQQFGATISRFAQSRAIYRKLLKSGRFKTNSTGLPTFVKRSEANFESWHEVPAHKIVIPARPFLGISLADRAAGLRILKSHLLGGAA